MYFNVLHSYCTITPTNFSIKMLNLGAKSYLKDNYLLLK